MLVSDMAVPPDPAGHAPPCGRSRWSLGLPLPVLSLWLAPDHAISRDFRVTCLATSDPLRIRV
jgi:hypothetical protein